MGFREATPIQAQAIPIALSGRDLIGCASTGTGKTAAFLLPILQRLFHGPNDSCRALVLSPTRELALQIDEQAMVLGYHVGLSAVAVVGGLDMGPQERALRAGAAIVVATPGRMMDHMRFDYVDLSRVEVVVLDEADRMLDMGFLPDIQRILSALPKNRQTLLFSATMSPTIRRLAHDFLVDPAEVKVDRQAPATAIVQTLHPVSQDSKPALLAKLLKQPDMDSVLVFVRRKLDVNRVASAVRRVGVECGTIHSGRRQEDRIAALADFRAGRTPVLIATDVAARGLDVSGISHVINFDVPHSPEDYIHRAGRTARAGATGDVITFLSPGEEERWAEIEHEIKMELPRTIVPGFEVTESDRRSRDSRRHAPRRGGAPSHSFEKPAQRSASIAGESAADAMTDAVPAPAPTSEAREGAPRRRRRRRRSGNAAASASQSPVTTG